MWIFDNISVLNCKIIIENFVNELFWGQNVVVVFIQHNISFNFSI